MDKELKDYFISLGFDDDEISQLKSTCLQLKFASQQDITKNIELLTSFGYPKEDIPELMLVNPNLFCYEQNYLKAQLNKLQSQNLDIEVALKDNPFLI